MPYSSKEMIEYYQTHRNYSEHELIFDKILELEKKLDTILTVLQALVPIKFPDSSNEV